MSDKKEYKSYKVSHTVDQVDQLLESELHDKINFIERLDSGEINATYMAHIAQKDDVILRISPSERQWCHFDREAWVFNQCRAAGVPTPEVLRINMKPMNFPEPYMITRRLPGINGMDAKLSHADRKKMCRELGHYLSLIHSILIPGFGPLVHSGGRWHGEFESMLEYLTRDTTVGWWIKPVLENSLMTRDEIDRVKSIFQNNRAILNISQGVLTHQDISPYAKNALVQGGRVTGIVDMEDAKSTDPVEDFAWFHFWGGPHADEFLGDLKEGYNDRALFDRHFMKKLNLYKLRNGCSLLVYFHKRARHSDVGETKSKIDALLKILD